MERFELALERIRLIPTEQTIREPYQSYFKKLALFLEQLANLYEVCANGMYTLYSMEQLERWNRICYSPTIAQTEELEEEVEELLSFLAFEIKKLPLYAVQQKLSFFVIYFELVIELYNIFEECEREKNKITYHKIRDVIYWFLSDYLELFLAEQVESNLCFEKNFLAHLYQEYDLETPNYLYLFGERVDEKTKERTLRNQMLSNEQKEQLEQFLFSPLEQLKWRKKRLKTRVFIQFQRGQETIVKNLMTELQKREIIAIPYEPWTDQIFRYGSLFSILGWDWKEEPDESVMEREQHQLDFCLYFDKAFLERTVSIAKSCYEEQRERVQEFVGLIRIREEERVENEEEPSVSMEFFIGKERLWELMEKNLCKEREEIDRIWKESQQKEGTCNEKRENRREKTIRCYEQWAKEQRRFLFE